MKRVWCLILAAMLLLALAGCGATPSEGAPVEETNLPIERKEAGELDSEKNETNVKTPFEAFKKSLDDAGFTYETVPMGAELIGAKTGEKYKFEFGTFELYEFEAGAEALEKAATEGGVAMEGFGVFPCEINENLVAFVDLSENRELILDLFNAL